MKHLLPCAVLELLAAPVAAQNGRWQQLLNGRNPDEWMHAGPEGFKLVSGMLESYGGMGLLW